MSAPPAKRQKGSNRDAELVINWLRFETAILQKLVLRNRDQHRGSLFMRSVTASLRLLNRFNAQFAGPKRPTDLAGLHGSDEFNRAYALALDSVKESCLHLSRVHAHRHFVPFSAALIGIFSRIFLLLLKVPDAFNFPR